MSNIGCRIVLDFKRQDKSLYQGLADFTVANVDDCMNRMAAMDANIRPMNKNKLLGIAFTIKVPAGDNLMFHKAMDMAKPGDIIVIDAGAGMERAIFGELMIRYCVKRGIAGVIVDGCIRDSDAMTDMPIPIYARGISPNGPYKNGPGEINMPITCGGQIVCPGDIIMGDADGIIVIKPEEVSELINNAKKINIKENNIMEEIQIKSTYVRPWVDEKLAEIGCELIKN